MLWWFIPIIPSFVQAKMGHSHVWRMKIASNPIFLFLRKWGSTCICQGISITMKGLMGYAGDPTILQPCKNHKVMMIIQDLFTQRSALFMLQKGEEATPKCSTFHKLPINIMLLIHKERGLEQFQSKNKASLSFTSTIKQPEAIAQKQETSL